MKKFVIDNNVKLRPHAKMHKSVDVANYQINLAELMGFVVKK